MYIKVALGLFVLSLAVTASKFRREEKDDNHWCCINDTPATIVRMTRVKVNYVQKGDAMKAGYRKCGAIGNKRCAVYQMKYRMEPEYMLEFMDVPQKNSCPDQHVNCCDGYLNIGGNCVEMNSVKDNGFVDNLDELNKLGLLGKS